MPPNGAYSSLLRGSRGWGCCFLLKREGVKENCAPIFSTPKNTPLQNLRQEHSTPPRSPSAARHHVAPLRWAKAGYEGQPNFMPGFKPVGFLLPVRIQIRSKTPGLRFEADKVSDYRPWAPPCSILKQKKKPWILQGFFINVTFFLQ